MSKSLRLFWQVVFLLMVPAFGILSWLFCMEGIWILTYAASGCSFAAMFIAWFLFD